MIFGFKNINEMRSPNHPDYVKNKKCLSSIQIETMPVNNYLGVLFVLYPP